MRNEDLKPLVKCHKLLRDCISFEHIEDSDYIVNKLKQILKLKPLIPEKMFMQIEKFMNKSIFPILLDEHYFDFKAQPKYGHFSEDNSNVFVVNSEDSMYEIYLLKYYVTFELADQLDEFFLKKVYGELAK